MISVTVTTRNGFVLSVNETELIDPLKISIVRDTQTGTKCEIVYARNFDRREKPDTMIVTSTVATILAAMTEHPYASYVILKTDGTAELWYIQDLFIKTIVDSLYRWNGVDTDCVMIDLTEGAFANRTVFALGQISGGGVVTTTTTTAAVVTTTTTATPTTTTTTAAPATTTTTTAAVTTTTTAAPATTTTTTAAVTTTTTTS